MHEYSNRLIVTKGACRINRGSPASVKAAHFGTSGTRKYGFPTWGLPCPQRGERVLSKKAKNSFQLLAPRLLAQNPISPQPFARFPRVAEA